VSDLGFDPPSAKRPGMRRLLWALVPVGLVLFAGLWFVLAQPVEADEVGVRQV